MTYRKYRTKESAKFFQPIGNSETPDTTAVTVIEKDSSDNVLRATGTSVPGSEAGFSKGCIFIKTDAGAGTEGFYRNIGTTAVSSFGALDTITPTEIALATGSVLLGNASSKAAAFDASGDTKVLVGNATTITSVALSGEITMTNAGVTTVGTLIDSKTIQATNDGATGGLLVLEHVSTTPANYDLVGGISGIGRNDNTPQDVVEYGRVGIGILGATAGAEFGAFAVKLQNGSGALPTTAQAQFTVNGASGSIGVTRVNEAAEGAGITLTQISTTPSANDEVGYVKFVGYNDNATQDIVEYTQIAGMIMSETAGAEMGVGVFKAQNGTGSIVMAGGWQHDGSYGHLIAGDGTGQGWFTSMQDNDVVLATGNSTTGTITITNGAAGAITISPDGAGIIDLAGGIVTSETTATSGAGAVAITGAIHEITTTGTGDAMTLGDGAEGQHLHVVYVAEGAGGDTAIITPTNLAGANTTVTFTDLGDSSHLLFTAGAWYFVGGEATIA